MDDPRIEGQIRAACEGGDADRAVTLLLDQYGKELLLFVVSRLRNQADGEEAFAALSTTLWRGLPTFAWRASVRTWAYALARNAAADHVRSKERQRRHLAALDPHLATLIDRVRTETALHLRTASKDRIRALRDRLRPDDRTLLALRVDRAMDWLDLARVMLGDSEGRIDDATLQREAARLRKRFERVKTELRRMAEEEGLLPRSSSSD